MNFSPITDDLFIGTTPFTEDYNQLRELGVKLVINMRFWLGPRPDLYLAPIQTMWLRSLDNPIFPISIRKLTRGAQAALQVIQAGGKVYTHCAYGRHRGVAMGTCVLISQGMSPQAAMELVTERRSVADPFAYYIQPRILKFAKEWSALGA